MIYLYLIDASEVLIDDIKNLMTLGQADVGRNSGHFSPICFQKTSQTLEIIK
jgi:hypothetical protein